MKRVALYPHLKYFIPILYGVGIFCIVFGAILVVLKALQSLDNSYYPLLINSIFQIPVGIMFIFWANKRKANKKYHISWNKEKLYIHIIDEEKRQIPIEKIKEINIESYRIEIIYKDLCREDFQYYKGGLLLDSTYQELKMLEMKFS